MGKRVVAPALVTLLTLLAVIVPRSAEAHPVGISRGEYEVRGASVAVMLLFARPEITSLLPEIDTDHDGAISAGELAAASALLDRALVQGMIIAQHGIPCVGSLDSAALTEGDGLSLRATFRCSEAATEPVVTLGFLDRLAPGHRHLATIGAGPAAAHVVAYAGHSALVLAHATGEVAAAGVLATVALPLFRLGVTHILTGYDHLVFLFGLMLVGKRVRSLLLALTAFTLAHSITLGLAALRVWSPTPTIVEPAIALSIAYVGFENLSGPNADRRWLITFPFGLIHGFGFAGALQEISLPAGQVPLALASFNLGVEAGQIGVLLLVVPALFWLRRYPWFVDRGVKGLSAMTVAAGVWWFAARVWF
jgi:hypothetical protein